MRPLSITLRVINNWNAITQKESQGIWVGGEGFGLDGKVVGPEFQNLLDGRHPSGESLITAQGEKRRVGY